MAAAKSMIGGGKQVSMPHEARRSSKKHLRRLSIERAKNGGYSVSHQFDNAGNMGNYEPDETHAFGADDHQGLLDHVKKHMGINRKLAQAAPEGSPAEEAAESPAEEAAENA